MWPKILIELIPHISRLVPMADKFFASRGATDEATQQSIAALRGDLAATANTHASLYRQMNEQSAHISQAAADAATTRAAVLALDTRLSAIESAQRRQNVYSLLILVFLFVVILTATMTTLMVWSHRH